MKIFYLLSILFSTFASGQFLERYPEGHFSYVGGDVAFYKDFHQILKDKNIVPCENTQEMYVLKVVVYEDASVKIAKEQNAEKLEKNKCTYETIKKVLPEMTGWNPAIYQDKKMPAVAEFPIYLDDLFENFPHGYAPSKYITQPEFPGGLQKFRNKFTGAIRIPKLDHTNGEFTLRIAFDVSAQGEMENVRLLDKTGYDRFDASIIKGIQYLKYKWKPGSFHGVPIKTSLRIPIHFTFH